MSEPLRIVAVAVRWEGLTLTAPPPARHHDLMRALQGRKPMVSPENQGFLTSDGQFVDRVVGLAVARAANQITHRPAGELPDLYSEDLW